MSQVDITNFSEEMKQNVRRTAEINRYYELKYAEYKNIAFEFAVGLIIVIAITVLGDFLPDSIYKYSEYIVIIISVFVLVRLGTRIFDLSRRSPIIFDEYQFGHPSKYQDYELSKSSATGVGNNVVNIDTDTLGDVSADRGYISN
tara:strand:- start:30 stop:464 length:435 start_codon:yes stop_codon:yes gene_type:complete